MSIDITNNWNSWNTRYELSSDDDSAPLELIIAARETKMDVVITNHFIVNQKPLVYATIPEIIEMLETDLLIAPVMQRV